MNTKGESYQNPVRASIKKLVGLRTLAHAMNLPDSELGILAIVIAQTSEVTQVAFEVICAQCIADPGGQTHIANCMELLRITNAKIDRESLTIVIVDPSSESTSIEA